MGDNIYNDDGTDQTGHRAVDPGGTAQYSARLENAGEVTGTFWIKGPVGNPHWTVRYYRIKDGEPEEVTDLVTRPQGWRRPDVPPEKQRGFLITVTPHSALPSGQTFEALLGYALP